MMIKQNRVNVTNFKFLWTKLIGIHSLILGQPSKYTSKNITQYLLGTKNKFEYFKLLELKHIVLKFYPLIYSLIYNKQKQQKIFSHMYFNFDTYSKLPSLKEKKHVPLNATMEVWFNWHRKNIKSKWKKKKTAVLQNSAKTENLLKILFVTQTAEYREFVLDAARNCNAVSYTTKWLYGTLSGDSLFTYKHASIQLRKQKYSNFYLDQIKSENKKINYYYLKTFTKYQQFNEDNLDWADLQKHINFIKKPKLIIIPDIKNNLRFLDEIKPADVPVVGLINSDCCTKISYPIFGNTESLNVIYFFLNFLSTLIKKTTSEFDYRAESNSIFFTEYVNQLKFKQKYKKREKRTLINEDFYNVYCHYRDPLNIQLPKFSKTLKKALILYKLLMKSSIYLKVNYFKSKFHIGKFKLKSNLKLFHSFCYNFKNKQILFIKNQNNTYYIKTVYKNPLIKLFAYIKKLYDKLIIKYIMLCYLIYLIFFVKYLIKLVLLKQHKKILKLFLKFNLLKKKIKYFWEKTLTKFWKNCGDLSTNDFTRTYYRGRDAYVTDFISDFKVKIHPIKKKKKHKYKRYWKKKPRFSTTDKIMLKNRIISKLVKHAFAESTKKFNLNRKTKQKLINLKKSYYFKKIKNITWVFNRNLNREWTRAESTWKYKKYIYKQKFNFPSKMTANLKYSLKLQPRFNLFYIRDFSMRIFWLSFLLKYHITRTRRVKFLCSQEQVKIPNLTLDWYEQYWNASITLDVLYWGKFTWSFFNFQNDYSWIHEYVTRDFGRPKANHFKKKQKYLLLLQNTFVTFNIIPYFYYKHTITLHNALIRNTVLQQHQHTLQKYLKKQIYKVKHIKYKRWPQTILKPKRKTLWSASKLSNLTWNENITYLNKVLLTGIFSSLRFAIKKNYRRWFYNERIAYNIDLFTTHELLRYYFTLTKGFYRKFMFYIQHYKPWSGSRKDNILYFEWAHMPLLWGPAFLIHAKWILSVRSKKILRQNDYNVYHLIHEESMIYNWSDSKYRKYYIYLWKKKLKLKTKDWFWIQHKKKYLKFTNLLLLYNYQIIHRSFMSYKLNMQNNHLISILKQFNLQQSAELLCEYIDNRYRSNTIKWLPRVLHKNEILGNLDKKEFYPKRYSIFFHLQKIAII